MATRLADSVLTQIYLNASTLLPKKSFSVQNSHASRTFLGTPLVSKSCLTRVQQPWRLNVRATLVEEAQLDDPETDLSDSSEKLGGFQWRSAWYGVLSERHADTKRPHGVWVLGRPYVLWRDATGTWRAFVDECPHRRAPLSEGRLDSDGRLQCSYHGWTFGPSGSCENIPQAQEEGPEAVARLSNRACAIAIPVTVALGLIFIWPDENGWEEANRTSPPLPENLTEEFEFSATLRDLPYGYEMLAENFVDLSHLPFAHHGVGGLKRSVAKPTPAKVTELRGPAGFKGWTEDIFPSNDGVHIEFNAPTCIFAERKNLPKRPGSRSLICFYITPTTPGNSRVIVLQGANFSFLPKWLPLPDFVGHLITLSIIDGDSFLLHAQEKTLQRNGMDLRQLYFMPCSADRFVVALRQWFSKYAGGSVQWDGPVNTSLPPKWDSREQVLDRLHSHTQNCTECSATLKAVDTWTVRLQALFVVLLSAAAFLQGSSVLRLTLVAGALLAIGISYGIRNLRSLFVYKGWDHATNE